ncbi:MAG: hypothetical protein ABL915_07175, partial [Gallionella sp.]
AMQSGSQAKVTDFAAAHHMSYPLVMGNRDIAEQVRKAAQQADEIEVLPSNFLFGRQGELLDFTAGDVTQSSVESFLHSKKTN